MRVMAMALAAVAVSGSATAQAPQFDVICRGEQRIGLERKPHEIRYRIDLTSKRWCSEDCVTSRPVQKVTADRIVLQREKQAAPTYSEINRVFSRQTGKVTDTESSRFGSASFSGTCDPAPFSGLPTPKS